MSDTFNNLPSHEYEVIVADPAWSYYGQEDKWGAAAKFYDLTSDEAMLGFPMRPLLTKNGVLFLWATCPRLDFAIECIKEWGLHYRGVGFVWVKTKRDGTPLGAQGVRPSTVKPLTEMVLVGSPQARGRPLRLHDESICQTVFSPRLEHSSKPRAVQDRIDSMYPTATKLELFARRKRPGWYSWGNEV